MQQAQTVSLPAHFQALSESSKLYEPGECYAEFVRKLPKNLPKERLHSDSISSDNTRYQKLWMHANILEIEDFETAWLWARRLALLNSAKHLHSQT